MAESELSSSPALTSMLSDLSLVRVVREAIPAAVIIQQPRRSSSISCVRCITDISAVSVMSVQPESRRLARLARPAAWRGACRIALPIACPNSPNAAPTPATASPAANRLPADGLPAKLATPLSVTCPQNAMFRVWRLLRLARWARTPSSTPGQPSRLRLERPVMALSLARSAARTSRQPSRLRCVMDGTCARPSKAAPPSPSAPSKATAWRCCREDSIASVPSSPPNVAP
mmetsp:Transcript_33647/g.79854  ORF Transcript_33647/g.79854 Transcript_33647/m.79854 type:complete len:231 (-) Transcript_33647:721-1413(-)